MFLNKWQQKRNPLFPFFKIFFHKKIIRLDWKTFYFTLNLTLFTTGQRNISIKNSSQHDQIIQKRFFCNLTKIWPKNLFSHVSLKKHSSSFVTLLNVYIIIDTLHLFILYRFRTYSGAVFKKTGSRTKRRMGPWESILSTYFAANKMYWT